MNRRADLARHFANCTRETARAAIGQAAVERTARAIAHGKDRIEHLLLGDGVADLHRMTEFIRMLVGEFRAGESSAVNAIATSSASDGNDGIAFFSHALHARPRHDADAAAVNQRISHITIIEIDRAVQRGNAHAVSVIAHSRVNLTQHALGIKATLRHLGDIWIRNAENIRGRDRLRAQSGADDVADTTANTGCRAAIWLDRARTVVRLALEADGILVVERDHARIVDEDREAPVDARLPIDTSDQFMRARCHR